MKFTKAIVRRPCENMLQGITSKDLGAPDYSLALKQHDQYIRTLESCGLEVIVLEKNNTFPDSVFIEDTAVLTKEFAIITNPSPKARKEEIVGVIPTLKHLYKTIEYIAAPGTLEGGDIMMIDNTFYIGKTARSNEEGIRQFSEIVKKHGYQAIVVEVANLLHLKTGIASLEHNNILVTSDLSNHPAFQKYNKILPNPDEAYAANSLNINEQILIPKGFKQTKTRIEKLGYQTIEIDTSEFRKLDGGLSCLSLRV